MHKPAFIYLVVLSVLTIVGCDVQSGPEGGATIFFENKPQLRETAIYFNGKEIGTIRSTQIQGRMVKMHADLNREFTEQNGSNVVFYPRYGRLEAVRLSSSNPAMQEQEPLSGFSSPEDLGWFKFTTLASNPVSAAKRRARLLEQRFAAANEVVHK